MLYVSSGTQRNQKAFGFYITPSCQWCVCAPQSLRFTDERLLLKVTFAESPTHHLCLTTTDSSLLLHFQYSVSSSSFQLSSPPSTNQAVDKSLNCTAFVINSTLLLHSPTTHMNTRTNRHRKWRRETAMLTFFLLLSLPIRPGGLWQQLLSLCVDVATHLWRSNAAEILDVLRAVNQHPAIRWTID